MQLDWIIQDPIDFEHKQYLILDYVKKTGDKLEKFELYPAFQELTLLYTSAQRVLDHGQFITLKREPEEIDDEILITDLIYNTIRTKDDEESQEILRIAKFARDRFKDLFMLAKSLWSIVNETISVELENNLDYCGYAYGYFHFNYKGQDYLYEYKFYRLGEKSPEHKSSVKQLEVGDDLNIDAIIMKKGAFCAENGKTHEDIHEYGTEFPIFKITLGQEFPLEGCLLSLIKRKVMNYIFQTINIQKLKKEND